MSRTLLWGLAALSLAACGGQTDGGSGGSGGTPGGGSGGTPGGGSGGTPSGGSGGTPGGGSGGIPTGGSGGVPSGGTGGVPTGGAGGTPSKCEALEQLYATTLASAKSCNPMLSKPQCTQLVPDELACPCDTYVNVDNTSAIATLKKLQAEWSAASCIVPCPAIACIVPQAAGCVPSGAGGDAADCQDFGPD